LLIENDPKPQKSFQMLLGVFFIEWFELGGVGFHSTLTRNFTIFHKQGILIV